MKIMPVQKGFTLLEVLIAIGIFLFIISGIVWLMIFSFRSNKIIWEQLSTQNEGRKMVQDFTNDLRTAAASSIGAYAIESATAEQIVFYSNIDTDSWRERVRYFKDGTNLKKGITKPNGSPLTYNPANEAVTIVAHDIANGADPVFYYYDQNFTGAQSPLAAPVDVTAARMVKISLELEEDPTASPAPLHVEAIAEIRNLKSN